jgi:uncharacterized membrane protein YecN with MAPEG domain
MALPITAIYAGLLGLIGLVLAAGSGWIRSKTGVSLGDGGHPEQLVAVRRHGNFAEWVPMALILIATLELNDVPAAAIHSLGAALVLARIAHPLGLDIVDQSSAARGIGAGLTALVVLVASIWSITTGL